MLIQASDTGTADVVIAMPELSFVVLVCAGVVLVLVYTEDTKKWLMLQ